MDFGIIENAMVL